MTPVDTIPVRVTAADPVTPLITEFALEPADGAELPAFSAGAHVTVVMRAADRTFRNPYTLVGSPWDTGRYRIAVRRDDAGRGGSKFLHAHARPGTRLDVTPPLNLFPLAATARKHLFVAGGVGVTPFLAMTAELGTAGTPWELRYTVRSADHDGYGRRLRDRYGPDRVKLRYGRPADLADLLAAQPLGTHVYTCGPAGLIAAVADAATALGWPPRHVHAERFTAAAGGEPFDAHLARSGVTVRVPADRSLLDAVEAAGVAAPALCRAGACGECETAVLSADGDLLHHDHWLSAADRAAGAKLMPCVSRARGRVVLDR